MNKFISYTAVILWMALIFYFSHQPANKSNELSTGITEVIVTAVEKVAPHSDFIFENLNHLVRKNAHFLIYLVLGVLLIHSLRLRGVGRFKGMGLALFICVLYAISDEVHQLFVPGRGAQVRDVLIDSAGAFVGIGVYGAILFRTRMDG
ncbi:VanZ family protein [Psychrobacillus sp. OK032]|uniref:VanZ family protein n=1 Tax=Psychrobacillus sp. OK032 TaxID=1884358 RepID=UPI0008B21B87|nr:VanZ family protein [Psychrobacillus sp. OK032]SER69208.1 VanZ like family protein [Psychrobacillus sp. OK032]